jgi:23S rRNA (adenine2503-C2)-methyltransferase
MQFFNYTIDELASYCKDLGLSPTHAPNLLRAAYKELMDAPWQRPGLPKSLAEHAAQHWRLDAARPAEVRISRYDQTVKFATQLVDDALVETVLMPERGRLTLCLSSQVGCAQACSFCQTGRMGLKRQLTPAEIVGQVVMANRWLKDNAWWLAQGGYATDFRVTNCVFMGMGEPLDNVTAVKKSLKILAEPLGLNLAPRRIAVSTAGHLPGLQSLLAEFPSVSMALSLHSTDQRERSRLMPINRRWPMTQVLDFLREHYQRNPRRHLLIQYTVIAGVNDTLAHAEQMGKLLTGLPVKVNLIPLNDIDLSRFEAPAPESLQRFRDALHQQGLRVMVRYSKGQDIAAACGQLAVQNS